jgi:hypothetical protein
MIRQAGYPQNKRATTLTLKTFPASRTSMTQTAMLEMTFIELRYQNLVLTI